jgi:hypothetical protein
LYKPTRHFVYDLEKAKTRQGGFASLAFAEEPGPILGRVEDAQYPNQFRLDSVKNQVISVAGNRPEAYAGFSLTARLFQRHSFPGRVSKLDALLDDGGPDARSHRWVTSRNMVFYLVEILFG